EDGIRDRNVTGVQTCALPISPSATIREQGTYRTLLPAEDWVTRAIPGGALLLMATVLSLLFANTPLSDLYFTVRDTYLGFDLGRSEERRVGKQSACRRWR